LLLATGMLHRVAPLVLLVAGCGSAHPTAPDAGVDAHDDQLDASPAVDTRLGDARSTPDASVAADGALPHDTASGVEAAPADGPPPYALPGRPCGSVEGIATGIAFSPDSQLLAVLGREALKVVAAAGGAERFSAQAMGVIGDTRSEVAFSPDGTVVATGGKAARVWRVADGALLADLPAPTLQYYAGAAFSPDGKLLAFSIHTAGVELYQWPSMKKVGQWTAEHMTAYGAIAFFPDGERLAVRTFYDVRVIRASSGEMVWSQPAAPSHPAMALSRDGARLATAGLGPVRVHDTANGNLVREFEAKDGRVSFSPDGKLLLVGDRFKPAVAWRLDDGGVAATFASPGPSLLLFSPDGAVLATASQAGAITLWCR
jgi:WD40 repeat protein